MTLSEPRLRLAALNDYALPVTFRFAGSKAVAAAHQALGDWPFDAVHVFRLYLAPFAAPLLGRVPTVLDLDDDEARTARSMATLERLRGNHAAASFQETEAEKLAALEQRWAPRFSTVCFAGPDDAGRAAARLLPARTTCIANAVELPAHPPPPPPLADAFTLLFVGSMGYPPNHDAAIFLAEQVLPRLRQRTGTPVRLLLAGSHPDPALQALARPPEIEVTGWVDDLAPLYAACHAVAAPLRAGGGTRIKILEAFAHGRPVVATPLGAEGIAARDGEHLLLAQSADDLALAIGRLIDEPGLAAALARRARAFVASSHDRRRIARRIERLFESPPARA
jgi:glycosyltransferase involved in cell wall biosynthesis